MQINNWHNIYLYVEFFKTVILLFYLPTKTIISRNIKYLIIVTVHRPASITEKITTRNLKRPFIMSEYPENLYRWMQILVLNVYFFITIQFI